jgi:serine/threonine protein phosphatase PrpC
MFAVFDGHLGTEASQYLADHLESRLCDALQACQFHPDETDLKSDIQVLNLTLKRVFQDIDQAFLHAARIRKKADGSCAAVLLVLGQLLVTAHVGDSRIVLCHRGTATALTTDHKPENEEERQRIEDKGGHVNNINGVWRVGHTSTEVNRPPCACCG